MFNVFIGYDKNEVTAYHVLSHSLITNSSKPVRITPVMLGQVPQFSRERGPTESTDFSISRFMVPYMSNYKGYSIFMDCDMLCFDDLKDLWQHIDLDKAVSVVKHDYTPTTRTKFLGQTQTRYPRKNWSSLMVFNNPLCKALTPQYVNTASGLDLHRFNWVDNDAIGDLPLEWNWLVGEYLHKQDVSMVHYTLGGPWFPEYQNCDYSEEWFFALRSMLKDGKR